MSTVERDMDGALRRLAKHGIEARKVSQDGRTLQARVVTFRQRDTYGTQFAAGSFDSALKRKMPKLVLHHEMNKVIGRATKVLRNDAVALELEFAIDSPDVVPEAAIAIEQLRNGTLTELSVGFFPFDPRLTDDALVDDMKRRSRELDDGTLEFTDVHELFEVSLVLVGSVPGTMVLAHRSATSRPVGATGESATSAAPSGRFSVVELAVDIGDLILDAMDAFRSSSVASKKGTRWVKLAQVETLIVRLGAILDEHDPVDDVDVSELPVSRVEYEALHEARRQGSVNDEIDEALAHLPHAGYTDRRVDDGDLLDEIDAALAKVKS